jgi:hypothetical protein
MKWNVYEEMVEHLDKYFNDMPLKSIKYNKANIKIHNFLKEYIKNENWQVNNKKNTTFKHLPKTLSIYKKDDSVCNYFKKFIKDNEVYIKKVYDEVNNRNFHTVKTPENSLVSSIEKSTELLNSPSSSSFTTTPLSEKNEKMIIEQLYEEQNKKRNYKSEESPFFKNIEKIKNKGVELKNKIKINDEEEELDSESNQNDEEFLILQIYEKCKDCIEDDVNRLDKKMSSSNEYLKELKQMKGEIIDPIHIKIENIKKQLEEYENQLVDCEPIVNGIHQLEKAIENKIPQIIKKRKLKLDKGLGKLKSICDNDE